MAGNLAPFLNNFTGDTGAGGQQGLVPAPPAGSASAGDFLSAAGVWAVPSGMGGGVTTIGTIDSQTPAANGATISGAVLYLQSASGSVAGLMNTGSQTIAGIKKFTSGILVATTSNFLSLGSTNPTVYTSAATTATRTFTTPDANSNSVQPLGSATSHNWIQYLDSSGVQHLSQPAFTDISGIAASAQLPTPTTSLIGGVKAIAAVTSNWINSIDTTGTPQLSQPTFADISGLINLATQVTGVLPIANGGTSQSTAPTDGQLLIGNSSTSQFSLANLSAGSGVTIVNGHGTITISASSAGVVTSLAGTANQIAVSASTGSITLSFPTTLVVNGTITANTQFDLNISQTTGYLARGTLTSTTGGMQQSMLISSTMSPSAGSTSSVGIYGQPIFAAPTSQTISLASVFAASILSSGNAGTLTLATGFYYDGTGTVTGTIGKLWGAYFKQPPTGATASGALYTDSLGVGSDSTSVSTGNISATGSFTSKLTASQILLGTTNVTTITTSPTANRIFTIVDAASNSLQPQSTSTTHNWVQYIDSSGVQHLTQPAFSDISGLLNLATQVTGVLPIANGGTGQSTGPTNGQLLIGNTTGNLFNLATLTAGSNVTITNAGGSITIACSTGAGGVSTVAGTANQIAVSASTGAVTFSFTNGISIGSYQSTASPTGGILLPGQIIQGQTTIPSNALNLHNNTSYAYAINITGAFSGTQNQISIYNQQSYTYTGSGSIYQLGFGANITYGASSTRTVQYAADYYSSPTFTNNAGTITNSMGLYYDGGQTTSGTVTNLYGGYFANPVGTAATAKMAVYAANMSIGSASANPPSNGLLVSGKAGVNLTTIDSGSFLDVNGNLNCTGWSVGGTGSNAYLIAQTFSRDNIEMFWDCYYNGTSIISNSSNGNYRFAKTSGLFELDYASVTSGSAISFAIGIALTSSGNVGIGDGAAGSKLSVLGNAQIGFASGTVAPSSGLAVSGPVSVGTTTSFSSVSTYLSPTITTTATLASIPWSASTANLFLNGVNAPSVGTGGWAAGIFNYSSVGSFTGGQTMTYAGAEYTAIYGGYNNGTTTNMFGKYIDGIYSGTGTVTNSYGLYVKNPGYGTYKVAAYLDNLSVGFNGSNLGSIGTNDVLVFGNITAGTAIPNASAQVTISSVTKGFLQPGSSSPLTNITSPATGLSAYNTTSNIPQWYNGTNWIFNAGMNLIFTNTITNQGSVSYQTSTTNIFGQYQSLFIVIENYISAVNGASLILLVSNNNGGTYYGSGYIGGVTSNDASAGNTWNNIASSTGVLMGVTSNASNQFGYLYMGNFSSSSSATHFSGVFHTVGTQQLISSFNSSSSSGYNAFLLNCSSGNIAKMTISVYGVYHP